MRPGDVPVAHRLVSLSPLGSLVNMADQLEKLFLLNIPDPIRYAEGLTSSSHKDVAGVVASLRTGDGCVS